MLRSQITMNYSSILMNGYQAGGRAAFSEPPRTPLGSAGTQLARIAGSSVEFMEHREYQPGDDLRRIDWNVFARSEILTVKQFREEVYPSVEVLLDTSRSMQLTGTKKGEAAAFLSGYLSGAAAESRFAFRLFTTENRCRLLERSHLVPTEWETLQFNSDVSPFEAMKRILPNWKQRGIRIFVSDLLFPAEPMSVIPLISGGAAVAVVIQLLSQRDVKPDKFGHLRLTDSESGEELEMFADALSVKRYVDNLNRHQRNYDEACRRNGVFFVPVIAEEFLENSIIDGLFRCGVLRFN
ncbi:MAG: DUF58 domain-containing protein [Planctomycetaceae bacterium]|nr:DUF58 domain-containing protein [Planctomycetaceae bacterium]